MFADEARFGRMNRPRPCWTPAGIRPKVAAQLIREYIYLYGAVTPKDGTCVYLIIPTSNTACFQAFLDALKLTDTWLVLLSAAAQRQDGAVDLGSKLKGGVGLKVIDKLLREQLVEEIPATGGLPVWRRDDQDGALALRITER